MSGNTWDGLGDGGGQKTRMTTEQDQDRGGQASSAWDKEKVQNRFKFSHIGKYSTVSRDGVEVKRGGGGGGYAGLAGGSGVGAGGRSVGQGYGGAGGMKRKLFSETAGPRVLD